jgi:hypothetical protein
MSGRPTRRAPAVKNVTREQLKAASAASAELQRRLTLELESIQTEIALSKETYDVRDRVVALECPHVLPCSRRELRHITRSPD